MLPKQKRPSAFRSLSRFAHESWVITRETNDELLLMMLFFGFRLFKPSFAGSPATAGFHSPNTGIAAPCRDAAEVGALFLLLTLTSDSFTPEVGGVGPVARGFGFTIGASDGCGGGVARSKSSWRLYVPMLIQPALA